MEFQLQAELEHEFRWQGASGPAYASIVGGGSHACVLHYLENDAPLRDGELVLVDAGAEFDLYAGDITRTFPVNGRFTAAQRALYEVVLAAQERAVAAVRPGATLASIHAGVVRDLTAGLIELGLLTGDVQARIDDGSYQRFYLHSTSHWLGLDVHDVGAYRQGANRAPASRHGPHRGTGSLRARRRGPSGGLPGHRHSYRGRRGGHRRGQRGVDCRRAQAGGRYRGPYGHEMTSRWEGFHAFM